MLLPKKWVNKAGIWHQKTRKVKLFIRARVSQGRDNLHRSLMRILMLSSKCFWTGKAGHLLEAHGYELLKIMGLKRHLRSLLDFNLYPVAIAARMKQHMYLSSQDLRLSSHLFPRPTSDEHQESCYPSTTKRTSQHCAFLHGAEIAYCHFTRLLTATLHPVLEARKAAEICLWHWEGS